MRLLFLLFLPLLIFAKPIWFYNIQKKNSNEIIGYGVSKDLYEAKKYAIDEIAKTLNLEINSSTKIEKIEKNKNFTKNVETNIDIKTVSNLENIKFLKTEQIDNLWYVAASYKNELIENIVKNNLKDKILDKTKQNSYLKNSPLIKTLNSSLGENIDYKLISKNKKWYLKYDEFITPLNQDDFYKLFYNKQNELIDLEINKKSFNEGDYISFKIETKKEGYVSLFNIERYGKVGVIFANEKIEKELEYPSVKDGKLIIANPNNFPIKELYIALFSKNKLDLNEFELVGNKLLDENSLKFNKLIDFLDDKNFCLKQINISKGY